jgi:predicted TIM-barrel fold metal-dependent hydrolase
MGHCSWPWHDECIAVYGKFLNYYLTRQSSEMFFDVTPGTPVIYREELLTKLFTVGYDVENNIMFGTDGTAHTYNPTWTKQWLDKDAEIFDRLGVGDELRQKLYHDNVLRFLGLKEKDFTHVSPACDGFVSWRPGVSRDDCR